MSHDIDDLLELIKQLESRIINLERRNKNLRENRKQLEAALSDAWYWEHG